MSFSPETAASSNGFANLSSSVVAPELCGLWRSPWNHSEFPFELKIKPKRFTSHLLPTPQEYRIDNTHGMNYSMIYRNIKENIQLWQP